MYILYIFYKFHQIHPSIHGVRLTYPSHSPHTLPPSSHSASPYATEFTELTLSLLGGGLRWIRRLPMPLE